MLPSREFRAMLPPDKQKLLDWQYELCRDGVPSIVLHGLMVALACQYPTATYWEILEMGKESFCPSRKQ